MGIERSAEMELVGYFLSRCGEKSGSRNPLPPSYLGVKTWNEAYRHFFKALGSGRTESAFSNSLKNVRDAFDAYIGGSGRTGWVQTELSGERQKILMEWQHKSDEELWEKIKGFGSDEKRHHLSIAESSGGSFIYYWADYLDDIQKQNDLFHLNQSSPAMAEIGTGAIVWAVSRSGKGHYILVARYVVETSGMNERGTAAAERGLYFFRANRERTIFFDVDNQSNKEDLLRSLKLKTRAKYLGQSFQGNAGVRRIESSDDEILEQDAYSMLIDARTTSSDALRWWNEGQPSQVLTLPEVAAQSPARKEYIRELVVRNRKHVRELKELYNGVCQVTGRAVLDGAAGDLTEVHHIHWLTDGGLDIKSNMLVVSPDIHAAIHAAKGSLEWRGRDLFLRLGQIEIKLAINKHLEPS